MDFVLSFLPWKIIWSLRMTPRDKIGMGIAMSFGILYVSAGQLSAISLSRDSQERFLANSSLYP